MIKKLLNWFAGPKVVAPEITPEKSFREILDAITRPAVINKRERYVCGFAFHGNNVVLIRKIKPEWQAGKLNGVGGKIEAGETPEQAMAREFHEEAGITSSVKDWSVFARCVFRGADVIFLRSFGEVYARARTMTAEAIEHWSLKVNIAEFHTLTSTSKCLGLDQISEDKIIPNLRWLIPLARHFEDTREVITISYGQN